MSDDMLDRLRSCVGFGLEVLRRPVRRELNHSAERSWQLHRRLSRHLTSQRLEQWQPTILGNLNRLWGSVRGQPP